MANNTLLASDNFASGLAAGWAAYAAASFLACQVVAGPATEPNTLSVEAGQIWTGLTWPNDQTSEITTTITNEAVNSFNLLIRMQSGAYSGYKAFVNQNAVTLYRIDASVGTQIGQTTGLTFAANDVWSLSASGSSINVYQNYKRILYVHDPTYTSGYPGFTQYTTTNLTHTKVFSWRGYNSVQQDGIWQKQGIVLPGIAADYASGGYGPQQPIVIQDTNPQILAGPSVYKMWFTNGTSPAPATNYAESADGITWTRYVSNPVLAAIGDASVAKVGSTYHLYGQSTIGSSTIAHYTSSDGITWSLQSANVLARGAGGSWDDTQIYSITSPFVVAGTWNMLYTGANAGGTWGIGLATSPDGITWTKSGSNPVLANVVGGPVVQVSGVYYMWPGVGPAFLQTGRYHSSNLTSWTNDNTVGLHNAEIFEGVNKQFGGAPAVSIINLGTKAAIYYVAVTNGTSPILYQIGLAKAPANIASIVTQSEDGFSQKATDNFTSGIGDLSANWTTPTGSVKLQIVAGNKAEATTTGAYNAMFYNAAAVTNDQYSQITIATITAGSDIVLMVRMQPGSLSGYQMQFSTTAATCLIQSMTSGSGTVIGPTAAVFSPQVGDVIRFAVIGNVLSIYQNGYLVTQVQDVNNTYTSGKPGFGFFSGTLVNAQVSGFVGGNANALPSFGSGGGLLLRGAGS